MTTTYRRLSLTGAGLVTLVTLVVSSVHLYEVSKTAGAGWLSLLTPVAVDGLGLTAAVSMWSARRAGEEASGSAVAAMIVALSASIGGNVLWPLLDTLAPEAVRVLAAIVAVYPAIALALSMELVLTAVREASGSAVTETTEELTVSTPETVGGDDPLSRLRQLMSARPDATSTELAPEVGRSASWVRMRRREIRQSA